MQGIIHLEDIRKSYWLGKNELQVLKGISIDIFKNEYVALMGPSGSGKSTLMNIIGCLDKPSSGAYSIRGATVATLNGDELAALRRDTFGFIFQRYNLMSDLSAVENAEADRAIHRRREKQDRQALLRERSENEGE